MVQVQNPLAVISPTLDANVLVALALAPETAFTTGQLQRVVPTDGQGTPRSIPGIRKVLERLVEQGIVTSQPAGRTVLYRLNRDHLAADHVVALARLRGELLDRMEQELAGWRPPPVYAAMFGSAARGQMRPDSDIDVFIVWADADQARAGEEKTSAFADQVTRWTGNDTRLLIWTADEVRERAGREPVLGFIAEDAQTLCGNSAWLRGVLKTARVTA
jgi:predicted nucleotidyltransferase